MGPVQSAEVTRSALLCYIVPWSLQHQWGWLPGQLPAESFILSVGKEAKLQGGYYSNSALSVKIKSFQEHPED